MTPVEKYLEVRITPCINFHCKFLFEIQKNRQFINLQIID